MAKLLLVEDDNNLREIYEARLQAEGYTIVSAKDGEETFTFGTSPSVASASTYFPVIWIQGGSGGFAVYYDSSSNAGNRDYETYDLNWPDPWNPTGNNDNCSIWCDYTPSGAGGNAPTGALYGPLMGPMGGAI